MLTKNDLKRKKFNLSELKVIPSLVFTPTTKIELPSNIKTLLFLLRKIQNRNIVEKYTNELRLVELQQQEPVEERDTEIAAINIELTQIEYSRHRLHAIYTQILVHLFHSKQLELLYVQSHESQPDIKNVLSVNYGGHTHRFQIKSNFIKGLNLEDRGIRFKKDPTALEPITNEQIAEYGYTPIEVIRECRRVSNYLTKRAKAIKEKNANINLHNIVVGKIKKMIAAGEVTLIDNTKLKLGAEAQEPKEKQKQAQSVVKSQLKRPNTAVQPSSGVIGQQAKKEINVIRKRSFKLNK